MNVILAEKCINYNFSNWTWSNGKIYGRLQSLWDKTDRILGKQWTLDPERMYWSVHTRTEESRQQNTRWAHWNNKQGDWPGVGKTQRKRRREGRVQSTGTEKQSRRRDMIIFHFNFVWRVIKKIGINKLDLKGISISWYKIHSHINPSKQIKVLTLNVIHVTNTLRHSSKIYFSDIFFIN